MTRPKLTLENDTWETGVAIRGPPGDAGPAIAAKICLDTRVEYNLGTLQS
jgi:hypothetical protein